MRHTLVRFDTLSPTFTCLPTLPISYLDSRTPTLHLLSATSPPAHHAHQPAFSYTTHNSSFPQSIPTSTTRFAFASSSSHTSALRVSRSKHQIDKIIENYLLTLPLHPTLGTYKSDASACHALRNPHLACFWTI